MDIKEIRKLKGLSQMKLAFFAGISRHRLFMHENGYLKLNKNELSKIIRILKSEKNEAQ